MNLFFDAVGHHLKCFHLSSLSADFCTKLLDSRCHLFVPRGKKIGGKEKKNKQTCFCFSPIIPLFPSHYLLFFFCFH